MEQLNTQRFTSLSVKDENRVNFSIKYDPYTSDLVRIEYDRGKTVVITPEALRIAAQMLEQLERQNSYLNPNTEK